jgi:hypothetical protein
MLYSILCYDSESTVFTMSEQEDEELMARLTGVTKHLEAEGRLGPRLRLMPTATATTLRPGGEVIDGPFAETKEALLGLYILDCETPEEALEIARNLARQKKTSAAATYEIRPVRWIDSGNLAG